MTRKTLSTLLQVAVFAGLLAAAGAMWAQRDEVVAMMQELSGDAGERQGKRRRGRASGAVPVIVANVTEQADTLQIIAVGSAKAVRSITLFPKVEGEITRFAVPAGARVAKGATVVQLESRAAQLAVEIAQTRLAEAKLAVARAAQLLRRRVQSAAKRKDARIVEARAKLELAQARRALREHTVRAPFAGFIGFEQVETGERVTKMTALTTLDDRSTILVEFDVPEKHVQRLAKGQRIAVTTPSFANRVFAGRIVRFAARVDAASRTLKVRAAIPNGDDALRPGMSFAIRMDLPGPRFATVPELAFQWAQGRSFVWRIEEGRARQRDVRLVRRRNGLILIEGDVAPGDLVVIEGIQRLRAGRAVRIETPPPSADAPRADAAAAERARARAARPQRPPEQRQGQRAGQKP
ncbi:MAG: efflux RND transporter periplasmic adaptor subunit [Pseudomonadota bacterium]